MPRGLVRPNSERTEHQVYETTDRTCYLCHRKVAEVADVYYSTDTNVCLCADHKDDNGIQGQFADPKDKPRNPYSTVRLIHSSTFHPGSIKRKSGRAAATSAKPVGEVKDASEEFNEGDMTPEVAAFLKSMGKL